MGGIGSGRRSQCGKNTTDNYRSLDVRRLQRDGLLTPGNIFGWEWYSNKEKVASIIIQTNADRLILKYQHQSEGGPWQPREYPVLVEWTGCNFGGRRAWFHCPLQGCGRRVALLYVGHAGVLACRHCHKLVYACQREGADDRASRRANTIRRQLGWKVGVLNPAGGKPIGMHWRTFERLKAEHHAFASLTLAGLEKWVQRIKMRRARLFGDLDSGD